MSLLIKNGTILSAVDEYIADLYIEGEKFIAIGKDLDVKADKVIDASGKYVFPGGVDEHVHYGSFGGRLFETTHAAAVGGTTTIVDFAPQEKDVPLLEAVRRQAAKAQGNSSVDFGFHSIIMDPKDSVFDEIVHLPEVGVSCLKLFMAYKGTSFYSDDEAILKAMLEAKKAGITMMVHAENADMISVLQKYYLDRGETEPVYHYYSRPPISEDEATSRAVWLARMADCPLFVVHVTTKGAMEAIRDAHLTGQPVFGETCTHYLTLTTDYLALPNFEGAKYVCSPPLRPQLHVDALWQAVREGWLLSIGSDHCALDGGFEITKKKGIGDFTKIPNGCPGVQDRLSLIWTYGVCTGKLTRQRFIDLTCTTPAKVSGLFPRKGHIAIGADADFSIFDPTIKSVITNETSLHGIDYTGFEGFPIEGRFDEVYLRGNLVAQKGKFVGEMGKGQWIHGKPYARCYDDYKLKDKLPSEDR